MPTIPDVDTFTGEASHTGLWPHHPVDFTGKQKRTFLIYAGGAPAYRERCEEIAACGYAGFKLS